MIKVGAIRNKRLCFCQGHQGELRCLHARASPDETKNPNFLTGMACSSRLFVPEALKSSKATHGLRVIVLERPGIGLSTPFSDSKPKLTDVAPVFREFCQIMGLQHVYLMAYSAGTPFAIAIARECPDIVKALAVVSSISPPFQGITKVSLHGSLHHDASRLHVHIS